MIDNFKNKGLRKQLVEKLRLKGIQDERVLKAIETVPRHFFLDKAFSRQAYFDEAFRIGADQTISQPYTVAFQTQLLDVKKGDKVLEIGTGSGYQSCILLEMEAKVFTIERQEELFRKAKIFLPEIGYEPKIFFGDGYAGLPTYAPFDKILVTAAAPSIPEELIGQLKTGGIMAIPVGNESLVQTMLKITKQKDGSLLKEEHGSFRFVPLLENKQRLI